MTQKRHVTSPWLEMSRDLKVLGDIFRAGNAMDISKAGNVDIARAENIT